MSVWAEAYWVKTQNKKEIIDILNFLGNDSQGLIKKIKDKWNTIIREEQEQQILEEI